MKKRKMNITPRAFSPRAFSPSEDFAQYVALMRDDRSLMSTEGMNENEWIDRQNRRERLAIKIARSRACSPAGVFEKLFIWRTECFEPSDGGFIYFDDLLPLSAYFDLIETVQAHDLSSAMDAELLAHLRTWRETG